MNWASARCSRATWPFITVKRAPLSLTPVSKSRPSGVPTSTWSLTSKSNLRGVPHLRTSTLAVSSAPTGTLSCGRLGTASSRACISGWICSRRAADCSRSPLSCATSAITASADSPLALSWPICLDRALRLACSSSVRVWMVLRSASRRWKASTSRNGWGDLRVSSRATTAGRSFRSWEMSSIAPFYSGGAYDCRLTLKEVQMAMQLDCYLSFAGNCEEALNFYAQCMGGKLTTVYRYEAAPPNSGMPGIPAGWEKKIMHATVDADGAQIMGSDVPPSMGGGGKFE